MSKAHKKTGWKTTRKKWLAMNQPDEFGYYECWICHQPVIATKVTLDHYRPADQYPELIYDLDNIRPAHEFCNSERGGGTQGGTRVLSRYGRNRTRRLLGKS